MIRIGLTIMLSIVCVGGNLSVAYAGGGHDHGHHDSEHDEHAEELARGPHGGRLLRSDDFSLELQIFEDGVEPQFRIYGYYDEKPLEADELAVVVELTRFGNQKNNFTLRPQGEYLTNEQVVYEPHSFVVSVQAIYSGKTYRWEYDSFEGRTEFSPHALKVANLSIETVGPAQIARVTDVYGKLIPNQNKVAHLRPRFSGLLKEVRKELGDRVEKGEVVAVMESNQSLQPYEIRSYVSGEVVVRHGTIGEFISEGEEILVVADLSEIWVDFQVYRSDFDQIERGRSITVNLGDERRMEAKVHYVSPLTDEVTQAKLVRAILPNPEGSLRPGSFVSGTLESSHVSVPVAVKLTALQTFRDWNVIYLTDGKVFQAMPVELGRRDDTFVEILSGIEAGSLYVAENSYIVKADIEKSGATHDH